MSYYIKNRRINQKNGVFDGAMGAVAPQNAPYLTRTNKSTSTPVKNDSYFIDLESQISSKTFEASKQLADEIIVRTILDPEGLRFDCRKGWLKMRVVN